MNEMSILTLYSRVPNTPLRAACTSGDMIPLEEMTGIKSGVESNFKPLNYLYFLFFLFLVKATVATQNK